MIFMVKFFHIEIKKAQNRIDFVPSGVGSRGPDSYGGRTHDQY